MLRIVEKKLKQKPYFIADYLRIWLIFSIFEKNKSIVQSYNFI